MCYLSYFINNGSIPFPHRSEFHPGASHTGPVGVPAPPLADPMQAGALLEAAHGKGNRFHHYLDIHCEYNNASV